MQVLLPVSVVDKPRCRLRVFRPDDAPGSPFY
jgi:hypothetical protein